MINNILEKRITLLSSRPIMGKIALSSEVIVKCFEEKKKVLIFSLERDEIYYLSNLMSVITGLSIRDVVSVFAPHHFREIRKIDRDKFFEGIETIQQSNLFLQCGTYLDRDVMDYLEEIHKEERFDFIMINNLDFLVKRSRYDIENIMQKFKWMRTPILLWNGVNRRVLEGEVRIPEIDDINHYQKVKNFIDNNIVLHRNVSNNNDIITIVNYSNGERQNFDYTKDFNRMVER